MSLGRIRAQRPASVPKISQCCNRERRPGGFVTGVAGGVSVGMEESFVPVAGVNSGPVGSGGDTAEEGGAVGVTVGNLH